MHHLSSSPSIVRMVAWSSLSVRLSLLTSISASLLLSLYEIQKATKNSNCHTRLAHGNSHKLLRRLIFVALVYSSYDQVFALNLHHLMMPISSEVLISRILTLDRLSLSIKLVQFVISTLLSSGKLLQSEISSYILSHAMVANSVR